MNQQNGTGKVAHAAVSPERRAKRKGLATFVPMLRICKECGVPLSVSKYHSWEEHGRILTIDASQRLVIMEKKIINGILDKVCEEFGKGVEDIFIYAKANDASQYVHSMMMGWRKMATAYHITRRPLYELLCEHVRILGMADAWLSHYQRGRVVKISCTQCYNKTFFAGDVLGAVYAAENREATIDVAEKDGEIVYTATVLEQERCEDIEGYTYAWEVPLPGYISYKRCRRCGIPFSVSFFSWDIPRGLMVDTHNGEQVTLIDVAGMNAAYSEIRAKHGAWVDDFLATEIKNMVDEILPDLVWKRRRTEEKIRDLFFLAYRGMGNPIFTEPTENGIRARIENPFNYPIVAGIAASFLARGKPMAFEWERSMPGRLEIDLHFL